MNTTSAVLQEQAGTKPEVTVAIGLGMTDEVLGFTDPRRDELYQKLLWIHQGLGALNKEERLQRTMELMRLWLTGTDAAANKVFGDCATLRGKSRVLLTMAYCRLPGGDQVAELRVWHKSPAEIFPHHADSKGQGLVCSIDGETNLVEQYLSTLLEIVPFIEVHIAGIRLFVRA